MSSSYLGITAHFFTRSDHVCHRVTLAVKRMPSPHTVENICQLVHDILRVLLNPSQKESARKKLLKRFKENQESASSASSSGISGTESPITITLDAQEGGPPPRSGSGHFQLSWNKKE